MQGPVHPQTASKLTLAPLSARSGPDRGSATLDFRVCPLADGGLSVNDWYVRPPPTLTV
jgi:hypothetical protein